ncbi:MFS transporter [Hoeflea prorocentri]|uniref:MFS transporter n=1 Tax=Hoeflea prorocentri TaxID=1922333 RepID=A0A9X3UMP9_9HYPH|nr:MFS transporter [Hoeflea prorocentri]MCY6383512.1 MFS transporter [Hoeflea prorocentri]MDA5401312.1 MFS transporter [Hoeflea prorocentri]
MRAAVSAMFLMNGFVVGSWAPLVPELAARHALSESRVGFLILALGLGSILIMPLSGALIARIGARPVLRVTSIACCFVLLPLVFAPAVPVLVAVLFVFGGVIGSMDIGMNANAVVVERRLKRAIMSSCHGFWSLGGLIGAASGGFLINWFGANMHAAIVAAVAFLIVLCAITRLAPDLPVSPDVKPRFRLTLAPMPYVVGLVALFSMVPEGAILDWGALYLRQDLGADVSYSGLAFGAVAATMATVRFVGDAVRRKFGAVRTVRYSALIAAAGLFVAAIAGSPAAAIAGFALSGIGIANLVPVALSAAGNLPGLPAGVGISIATSMGYSGILMAPALIGFIAEHNSFSVAFMSLAALFAVVLALSSVARHADIGEPATAGH